MFEKQILVVLFILIPLVFTQAESPYTTLDSRYLKQLEHKLSEHLE